MSITTRKFPENIMAEILSRLPIKSILKFRCVCKHWRNIIDHPNFIDMQFNVSEINRTKNFLISVEFPSHLSLCLRLSSKLKKSKVLCKYPSFIKDNLLVKGHINGLILVLNQSQNSPQLFLWNPSLRKSLLIPYYSCHPNSVVSFGLDLWRKEYKVMVFDFEVSLMHVYILGSGWYTKDINTCVHYHCWVFGPESVYNKGVVYLLVDVKTVKSNDLKRKQIRFTNLVCFDCCTEEFSVGNLPEFEFDKKGNEQRFLCVLGESLALMDTCRKGTDNKIWVMEIDEDSGSGSRMSNYRWTMRYQISSGIPAIPPFFVVDCKGDLLMYEFCKALFCCYDVRRNELKKKLNISKDSYLFTDLYVESLVLSWLPALA